MKVEERLLKYVKVKTPSDDNAETIPTSECQFDLARIMVKELEDAGVENVQLDEKCFVYGVLPATKGYEDREKIGFIAHMDTVSDFCEGEITPVITPNYDGEDVVLGTSGRVITVKEFPDLKESKGKTLITTDGNTILGADDKAGIAEIMQTIDILRDENIPHGQICIAFTPDEETGVGADYFDVEKFGADVAYTMDGDGEGEIQYQNFNACGAKFEICGKSVHPGDAKDIMVNAALVAANINNMLPKFDIPRYTEDYEGFYHLISINGDEGHATAEYIVRDFDKGSFEARKSTLRHIEKMLNETWGEGTAKLELVDQYENMEKIIEDHMYLIDNAKKACEKAGVPAKVTPIRGGTDGCHLSFRGLPCPNLGTGGHGFHGPMEHITVEGMEDTVKIMVELVKIFAEK